MWNAKTPTWRMSASVFKIRHTPTKLRVHTMQTHQQPTKIIRIATVLDRTGLSKPFIYQMIRRGEFPASIRLAPRYAGWVEQEVNDWLDQRIAAARGR
ncbi:AlpA family phage regulatory protein [Paraburkholderia sp. OAS925]|uniref:helix-turn-helix transcriptional regulator n=2 Tax=Paraburkholderia TaxID=1822464 RepID=UPI003672FBE2